MIAENVDWSWVAGALLVFVPLALTFLNVTYLTHLSRVAMVVGTAVVVLCPHVRLPAMCARAMAFAGDLSYPLYLFHAPLLLTYTWRFNGQNQWFVVGTSLALAAAMHGLDTALHRPMTRGIRAVEAVAAAALLRARRGLGP